MATYKDLVHADINVLKAELKKLNIQANKRLTRLQNSLLGQLSPSYTERVKRGKLQRFPSTLKAINDSSNKLLKEESKVYPERTEREVLLSQINKTKSFLSNKTSTLSGFKKVRNEINKKLNKGRKKGQKYKSYFPEAIKTEAQLKRQLTKERKFWKLYKRGENYKNYQTGKEIPSKLVKRVLTKLINRGFSNDEIERRLNLYVNSLINFHDKTGKWEDDNFESLIWKNIREK